MHCLLVLLVLPACSSLRTALEVREACVGPGSFCPVELAREIGMRHLRDMERDFVVYCGTRTKPLDEAYRLECMAELGELAAILSEKGRGHLAPISVSEIRVEEVQGWLETLTEPQDTYELKASIPLRWLDQ